MVDLTNTNDLVNAGFHAGMSCMDSFGYAANQKAQYPEPQPGMGVQEPEVQAPKADDSLGFSIMTSQVEKVIDDMADNIGGPPAIEEHKLGMPGNGGLF